MPIVSVMMVSHQVTPFLVPAVRSVFEQTLGDLELLYVDNGTGAGAAPLGAFGGDPRLRVLPLPSNLGIAAGYNHAVAAARGEFLAVLDSDDLALPRRLERQIAALRAEPELGLVSSCADRIDASGRVIGREFALAGVDEQRIFSAYSMPAPTPSYTGRTEIFRRFPFDDRFGSAADYDFLARALETTRGAGVPEILMQYRHHPGQTTVLRYVAQVAAACAVRLLTARRRAGRPEEREAVVAALLPADGTGLDQAAIFRRAAEWSLRDGFPRLAVYHARKLLSVRRTTADLGWAAGLLRRALVAERRERRLLVALFFGGPLRAHGLRRA